jgi:hypothetical protein
VSGVGGIADSGRSAREGDTISTRTGGNSSSGSGSSSSSGSSSGSGSSGDLLKINISFEDGPADAATSVMVSPHVSSAWHNLITLMSVTSPWLHQ